ncbi:MAG TPA: hypothetical protein PLL77_16095 [Pyrinomonadaceae bacterium]|nr:hypothetical protein [Pyrinomonadaceae bacterium]
MKWCDSCHQIYDNELKFCLLDGTALRLVDGEVAMNRPSFVSTPAAPLFQTANHHFIYAAFAVLLPIIGVMGTILLRGVSKNTDASPNMALENPSSANTVQTLNGSGPIINNNASASGTLNPGTSISESIPARPLSDENKIKQEISDRLYTWKRTAEERDINLYMQNYAETVDYYHKKAATKSFVNNDKQRAFSKFDSIKLTVDIVSIAAVSSGEQAEAVIDKEWLFQGGGYLAGKVRQQIRLRTVNGKWLISGEKDLKVYYVNK